MEEETFESVTVYNVTAMNSASNVTSSDATCRLYSKFAMHTVVAGIVCILGFVGNSVSFVVLIRDRGTPVASFMLRTLAFTDNFFLSFWFLHFSLSDMFNFFRWKLHPAWLHIRLYTYPFLFIGQTATIWMTVLIALSRYIAVCQPYKAAHVCTVPTVKKGVFGVALFSVLYNLPRFFETIIVVEERNDTLVHSFNRTSFGDSKLYKLIYFDISYYIICFVLPLVLLAVLNVRLTISYRKVLQRKRRLSNRQDCSPHCDPNITLVLIIVILVFMLCNTPARIVQVVWRYKRQWCMSVPFFLMEISNVLEVLNSSVNFIIYCVFRKKFRVILQETVQCVYSPESTQEMMLDSRRNSCGRPLLSYSMATKATQITEQTFTMEINGFAE